MDTFKIIYKILKSLERAMDYEEFDCEGISHEALKISYPRWVSLTIMLKNEGYIDGVAIVKRMNAPKSVKLLNVKITLKGLEYLHENSLMQKAMNIAKGITEIIK